MADNKVNIIISAVDNASAKVKQVQSSFKAMTDEGKFSKTELALAGAAIAGVFAKVGKEALASSVSFESAFAGMRKTIDATEEEFGQLSKATLRMSRTMPVSPEQLARIGELGGQLGVTAQDIGKFQDTIAKVAVTTNLTEEAAATAFARMSNIMQEPLDNIDRMASSVVELGNNFATTESEIAEFGLRISGAGKIAGLTTADVLGIGAAMSSVGVQAEAGGTAVQKVLTEMTKSVANGGDSLRVFGATAGMTSEEFKQAFETNAAGAFTRFVEGLGVSGNKAFAILEALGLQDQRLTRGFLSLANAGGLLREAIDSSNEAFQTNLALSEEAQKRFATVESQWTILWNNVRVSLQSVTDLALRPLAFMLTNVNAIFLTMADVFGKLPTPIQTVVKLMTGLTFAVAGTSAAIVAFTAASKLGFVQALIAAGAQTLSLTTSFFTLGGSIAFANVSLGTLIKTGFTGMIKLIPAIVTGFIGLIPAIASFTIGVWNAVAAMATLDLLTLPWLAALIPLLAVVGGAILVFARLWQVNFLNIQELVQALGIRFSLFVQSTKELFSGFGEWLGSLWGGIKEMMGAVWEEALSSVNRMTLGFFGFWFKGFKWLLQFFSEIWTDVAAVVIGTIGFITAFFTTDGKEHLEAAWALAMAGMKNITLSAWNKVLEAIEWGINKAIKLINTLIEGINRIPGINIPTLGDVHFERAQLEQIEVPSLDFFVGDSGLLGGLKDNFNKAKDALKNVFNFDGFELPADLGGGGGKDGDTIQEKNLASLLEERDRLRSDSEDIGNQIEKINDALSSGKGRVNAAELKEARDKLQREKDSMDAQIERIEGRIETANTEAAAEARKDLARDEQLDERDAEFDRINNLISESTSILGKSGSQLSYAEEQSALDRLGITTIFSRDKKTGEYSAQASKGGDVVVSIGGNNFFGDDREFAAKISEKIYDMIRQNLPHESF